MKLKWISLILLILVLIVVYLFFIKESEPTVEPTLRLDNSEYSISFDSQTLNCTHKYDNDFLAFVGGAVIDIEGDGKKEFYITSGDKQKDCLFKFDGVNFINIIDKIGIDNTEASYGVFAVDITGDSLTDLLVARESGLYIYENKNGVFEERLVYNKFHPQSSPIDIALSDYDNDGDLDIYVATFIKGVFLRTASFNQTELRQSNVFLENDGNLNFTDVTEKVGLSLSQNIFTLTFADLDNDNLEDLILGTNTDQLRIYRNDGGRFRLATTPTDFGFWMGIASNDFDDDGDIDLFLSNTGDTIPLRLLQGDTREDQIVSSKYVLLRNDGDFQFENILPSVSSNDFAFGWGIVSNDFNFDNKGDYLIMQNYIKWPPHRIKKNPGSLLLNIDGRLEENITESNLANRNFGFSSLIADFNNDGKDDVVYLNIGGEHSIRINNSTSNKEKFVVNLPVSGKYINTHIELTFRDGSSLKKRFNRKQGIMTTQDSKVSFYFTNKTPRSVRLLTNKGDQIESFTVKGDQTSILLPI